MKLDLNKHHGRENTKENQSHYQANLKKLNNNCRIILEQLLTGRKVTGIDVVKLGIMEYRKRFDDLKKVFKIPVKDRYAEGKRHKEWWLEQDFINSFEFPEG